jgi:lipopolysaccharide export system protein LptA
MRNRVEKLRIWLLGSAGFLLLVIVAFVGSAHFMAHRRLVLPARLGVNIVRETNGFTYYQAMQGKTVFAIHAAKAVEHTDGKIALHDVSITLYGVRQDRDDRIYGDEFEYDKNAGVVRATGVVHIDLQAAGAVAGKAAAAAANAKVLHVTTSGLVYLKDLGVAATSEYLEFQSDAMTGHATGADYTSDTGVLLLHSAVSMSGNSGKRPVTVTASMAQVDSRNQEIFLSAAHCVSLGQAAEAQQATLHMRSDGTLARIEAQGNVTREAKGSKLIAQRADVVLNANSQAQSAVLTDGVQYSSVLPLLQRSGQAQEVNIAFDAQGQAQKAVFTGAVHMNERMRATEAALEPWSSRDLTAAKVEAALVPVGAGTVQLRDVEATGSARLTAVNHGSLASRKDLGRYEFAADVLTAHMVVTGDGTQAPQLDTVAGRGHTLLHQVSADGIEQSSAGDRLDAKFQAQPPASTVAGRQTQPSPLGGAPVMLLSALQQGHVSMMRSTPAKSGAAPGTKAGNAQQDVERATAERAAYDGDLDRVTLTGNVQMGEEGSSIWAQQLVLDRKTGDAQASGTVKVDYTQDASPPAGKTQSAPAEPTHIVADRAEFVHATAIATFAGTPARLWQGGSQVQAPVIELSREQKRLIARGEASTGWSAAQQAAQVHTVLMGAANGEAVPGAGKPAQAAPGCANTAAKAGAGVAAQAANVVRIASGGLIFSGILNQADFTGGFRADSADGTIRANSGTVYLQQLGEPAGGATAVPSLTGRLQRVVAAGNVDVQQPALRATGERLVYTASDRVFLLTGDSKTPPQVTGATGTTTAAALRFHSSCDDSGGVSVEALSTLPGEPERRVQTKTRVGNDDKKEKAKR